MADLDRKQVENASSSSQPKETLKRPQLNYLHSAWTTTDLYYHNSFSQPDTPSTESSEENIYHIRLPPLQLQDCDEEEEEMDEVLREIFRMITIANIISLVGSVVNTGLVLYSVPSWHLFLEHHDWMPHIILPFYVLWWLFMIRVLRNRTTEHLRQYLNWTQLGASIMALTNYLIPIRHPLFYQYKFVFVACSLWSLFIYAIAKRIAIANELKHDRFKKRIVQEHERLQCLVDTQTNEFTNHRLAFLTTVSQEIQDVALMVITTLEQFSPASILSNTHELLSACSIAVPIASISAINTTIRQICHISSHLELLSKLTVQAWTRSNINLIQLPELNLAEFDIGELLQSLGDALAGVAAKLHVNLVIYHCDNNLHHTLVIGDEGAIRHALLNHIRNILECCTPGASIEVGLNVKQVKDPKKLKIVFYITHTSSPAIRNASAALLPNANLTSQLLGYIHASCSVDTDTHKNQTKFIFSFELESGKKDMQQKMYLNNDSINSLLKNHYANIKFDNEPSLRDLKKFIEHLKGLKMVLHAPEHSIFAKHMTSCLASWNTDISHVPVTKALDIPNGFSSSSGGGTPETTHSSASTPNLEAFPSPRQPATPPVPTPAIEEEHIHSIPPAFILIDDDITTLENKLTEFKSQPAALASTLQQANQNRRGHHHSKRSSGSSTNFFHQGTTAIIHFTSLTNYKAVRDVIQCYAVLPSRDPFSMPRIVVVPKPAGPRRFLTALHTAWNNSVVEPHYSAIATSPSSPMSPMISMLVQREIAVATSNASSPDPSAARISPGNETASPGRARRPVSGIFSPPTDNYFSSQPTRRKSNPNTDYLTASTKAVTPPPATPAIVPEVVHASSPVPSSPNHTNSSDSIPTDSATPIPLDLPNKPMDEPEQTTADTGPTFKKKVGRTMSNFKMHKKKRKDKGTPFSNVVSPPINVLIVEDNIINQAILSAWMKKHKIKFSVASNGLEAVNKWKIGGFHLILMDIQLPVMNGIEATRTIRSIEKEQKIGVLPMSSSFLREQQRLAAATAETILHPSNSTTTSAEVDTLSTDMLMMNKDSPSIFRSPVIIVALTASSLESDRHAALAAGCNDFLTKPVSLEWLEKKIIEWGCMQALIDFEGWRRWKKKSSAAEDGSSMVKKKLATSVSPILSDSLTREQVELEKKRIEELSKSPNKQGIMLPGVGNLVKSRRVSTVQLQQTRPSSTGPSRLVLRASMSESDTQTLARLHHPNQSDTTALPLTEMSRSTSSNKKSDTKSRSNK